MIFKSFVAGSALLAGSALAAETKSSTAKCNIKSITKASSKSEETIALVIKDISYALCGDEHDAYKWAHEAARKTAHAYAEAVAEVDVDCYASGNAQFKIDGKSTAYAKGSALATAFVKLNADTKYCDRCKAAGTAVAKVFKKIFVEATAELEPYFYGNSYGADSDITKKTTVYTRAYEEVTLDAFAKAIIEIRSHDDYCSVYVKPTAGAGEKDTNDYNIVTCDLDLSASSNYVVKDALAVAVAEVGAKTCFGKESTNDYILEAKAIASAYALAVTEVSGKCYVEGEGYGCAMGKAEIWSTAKAVAKSYAEGYGKAISKCFGKCKIESSALTTAIADVIATSYESIYFDQCTENNKHFDYTYSKDKLVVTVAPAIADLLVKASAYAHGVCDVVIKPEAYIGDGYTKEIDSKYFPIDGHVEPSHPEPTHPVKKTTKKTTRKTRKHRVSKKGGKKANRRGGKKVHRRGGKKALRRGGKKGGRRHGRRGGKKVVRKVVKKINIRRKRFGGRRSFIRGKTVRKNVIRRKD